ncbi:unnamed protein product [Umbelopsis ramanniana]
MNTQADRQMDTDNNQPVVLTPSSNGFLVYIVVVILVAIFLTYLLILCIIRPQYRHRHNRNSVSSVDGSSSHPEPIPATTPRDLGSSTAHPIVRRRSIDPDLLNEFIIQTFHAENKKTTIKSPSLHNYDAKDCVIDICPCPALNYPEPAHVVEESPLANPNLADTISEAPSDPAVKVEKSFDTRSIASSSIDLCPICLDQYEDGSSKIRVLPWQVSTCIPLAAQHVNNPDTLSSHYFHQECIDNWLLRENTTTNCPCCNFDLSTIPRAENRQSANTTHSNRLSSFWCFCSSS